MQVAAGEPGIVPRLVVGGVLLVAGGALVPVARHLSRRMRPAVDDVPAPWSTGDLVAVPLVAVLLAFLLAAVVGRAGEVSLPVQLSASVARLAGALLVAARSARRARAPFADAFAARLDHLPRAAACGIASYVLLVPALMGVALVWPALLAAVGFGGLEQPVVAAMRALPAGERPVALFLGVVLGPLCEELFFRGFLQRTLARSLPAWAAIGVTSLAFASLHGLAAFLPVFALSLILGSVLHATRRVGASWAVHALFNAQTFAFLWLFPEAGRVLEGSPPGLVTG